MDNWYVTVGRYVQEVFAELVVAGEQRAARQAEGPAGTTS